MEPFTIETALGEECHIMSDVIYKTVGIHEVSVLPAESLQLLQLRNGVTVTPTDKHTVCFYHEKVFITKIRKSSEMLH